MMPERFVLIWLAFHEEACVDYYLGIPELILELT